MRKAISLLALAVGCGGFGAAQTEKPATKDTPAAVDRRDDALPEGAMARLGTIRFRHSGPVVRVAYAADGKVVATTGIPGLCLWDLKTGQPLHKLPLPEFQFAGSLSISPDGKKLVTGTALIDVSTGKEIRRFKSPKVMFSSAAFSCDGRILAYSSLSKDIVLFDVDSGNEVRQIEGHKKTINSIAFSPTDKQILASAGYDTTVRIWNAGTGKQVHQLDGHGTPVQCVAFAPDGKSIASGAKNGDIRLWDVATGKQRHRLISDNDLIFDLAFSPNGKQLACTGFGGAISLWNPETGKKIRQWQSPFSRGFSVAFAPDGKTIASAGGAAICFWDVETGKEINPIPSHVDRIIWLRFDKHQNALLSCDASSRVIEWDLKSHRPTIRTYSGELTPPQTDAWATRDAAPDGKLFAQTSSDDAMRLWDTTSGKAVHMLGGRAGPVKFSPNGQHLASSGVDGLRLWDVASGKQLHHVTDKKSMKPLAFSPDSKELVSRGPDNTIQHWDVVTGKESRRWNGGKSLVNHLTFSPDGKAMAVSDFNRRGPFIVHLRAADTGKEILKLSAKLAADAIAFSPSGRILACGGGGKIQLLEVRTGQEIRVIETAQGRDTSLAFTPDGTGLASGGSNSTILLWDLTGFAKSKPTPLTAKMIDSLWSDLQSDAAKADRALWMLALSPQQTLPFLEKKLRPASSVIAERLAKLVADLENSTFEIRQKADRELVELGESVEMALRKRMENTPSLELRRRIEQILAKRDPDVLRQLRAIDTLEQIGAPEVREILQTLAKTTPSLSVARAAEAARERLGRK